MQKWEYTTWPLIDHALQEILNNAGDEGWELVTVLSQPTPSGANQLIAYMKRPKE